MQKEEFQNNPKGINTFKILVLAGLFIISVLLVYILIRDKEPAGNSTTAAEEEKNLTEAEAPVIKRPTVIIKPRGSSTKGTTPPIVKNDKIRVSGSNLESLRNNLLASSQRALISGNYTPVNLKVNLSTFSVSFELKNTPSNFVKLSLLYGPINTGCESCSNSLIKNPGSIRLYSGSDNAFEYGIIAIAE